MKYLIVGICMLSVFCANAQHKLNAEKQLKLAAEQYKGMLAEFQDTAWFPQSVNKDGSLRKMQSDWWCSGFFAGSLWYLSDFTKNEELKKGAVKWTEALQKEQYNTRTHDLGFMLYCSYGNGYRLTNNEAYKAVLLKGAESLSSRFNPKVGLIKSWDSFQQFKYPVIIDNMMNLEFLFWASKLSGNNKYRDISITHADNTLKNHFRADNSSYHVIAYDSVGNVLAKKTAQGAADSSAWARGQAWGLYGYTVMYRETKQKKYLNQAVKIAKFYMTHPNMPNDKVPYWDFNAPNITAEERDASAAAISSSALLELSHYVSKDLAKSYISFAADALVSLSSPEYFAATGNNHFILKHSTGHKPAKSEVDTPIIYADYYYIEALLRYQSLNN